MNIICYKNGNSVVSINKDNGERCIKTNDDCFKFNFPLNIDMKLTNKCNIGCAFCHENSITNGKESNCDNVVDLLDKIHYGTEIAYGGGSLTSYNDLEYILKETTKRNVIANCTFHYKEIIKNNIEIKNYQKKGILHGVGISIPENIEDDELSLLKVICNDLDNVVFHVIAGIVSLKTLNKLLSFKECNLLILGYKCFGRGLDYSNNCANIKGNISTLEANLWYIFRMFDSVSFDNLALNQLNVKNHVSKEKWELYYQGEDNITGMYIDMVEEKFAKNSTCKDRFGIENKSIEEMYNITKEK